MKRPPVRFLWRAAFIAGFATNHHVAAAQPAPPSPSVLTKLRGALQPSRDQELETRTDSSHKYFSGVQFIQGIRIPPFGSGEDGRPDRASVVIRGTDTVLVSRLTDLAAAWKFVRPFRISNADQAVAIMRELLALTGLLTPEDVLTSLAPVRARLAHFSDTSAFGEVVPPNASRDGDKWLVQIFALEASGVTRLDCVIRAHGSLIVRREVVARYKTAM
jgi:hypothetical protein